MLMPTAQYHAALLHLQAQGRGFVEAFKAAAIAARDQPSEIIDPLADQVMRELCEAMHILVEQIPGAREVFVLALFP